MAPGLGEGGGGGGGGVWGGHGKLAGHDGVVALGPELEAVVDADVVEVGELGHAHALAEEGLVDAVFARGPVETSLDGEALGALERELDHSLGAADDLVKVDVAIHV